MNKYSLAKTSIESLLAEARSHDVGSDDALLALLVSCIAEYAKVAGKDEARDALVYELENLGGNVDTVFLRSR